MTTPTDGANTDNAPTAASATEGSDVVREESHLEVSGATLSVVTWTPKSPRALLQIVHGMAEHVRRYDHVARAFAARGYAVIGHDHRGHGHTANDDTLGQMGDWSTVVQDVVSVGEHFKGVHPNLPLGVLAHSMGSFMAQQLILEKPTHAGAWVLSGSNGKPPAIAAVGRLIARFERWRLSGQGASALLDKLSFGRFNDDFEGRTDFDWLSQTESSVDAYVADPLCGFVLSTESWVSMLDALGPIADPYRQRQVPPELPIYIFGGDRDPVSEKAAGLRQLYGAYQNAGLKDVTLKLFEKGRHEILNGPYGDEATSLVGDWMDQRFRPN